MFVFNLLVSKLSCSFACFLCLLSSPESFKGKTLVVVGQSKVGIQAQRLFIGRQRLLIPLEVLKSIALAMVGQSIVGVQAQRLLISRQRLLILLEIPKSNALFSPLLFGFLRRWGRFL